MRRTLPSFRALALPLAIAATLCACGGSTEDSPASKPEAASSFSSAWCDWMARCDPHGLRGIGGAVNCKERFGLGLGSSFHLPGTNADDSWNARCAAAINAASCDNLESALESGCAFSPGSLPNGSECLHPAQCQSLLCSGGTEVDCGTCVESAALGEACGQKACRYDLVCDPQKGVCVAKVEPAPPKPGDPCSKDCEDLLCINGVCTALLALGQACDSDFSCAGDAWCSSGVCAPIKVVKTGEACGAGAECDGSYCKVVSATERVCAPFLADGDPCDSLQDDEGCLYPARCQGICMLTGPSCK